MKKLALIVVLLLAAACSPAEQSRPSAISGPESARPQIYTVNYPLAWMATELVGDIAEVVLPAPGDEDPAYWQPDVDAVLAYQQADLVLLNGANYARWLAKVSLPTRKLVDTSAAYSERLLAATATSVHSHGPGGEHSHGELAITTWLDLDLARQQLQAVAAALSRGMPQAQVEIMARASAVEQELMRMDSQLSALGHTLDFAPLLYSHPVYQYLQQRYQLNGKALHWEPDQVPGPEQWQHLDALLQAHPARIMLWEAEPLPTVRAQLVQRGIIAVVFQPMGNRPLEGDFISLMAENIAGLESVAPR